MSEEYTRNDADYRRLRGIDRVSSTASTRPVGCLRARAAGMPILSDRLDDVQ